MVWHRRDRNVIADFVTNHTMDRKESWSKDFEWPFPGMAPQDLNIMAHSDGGSRRGMCSATGHALVAARRGGRAWAGHGPSIMIIILISIFVGT